MLAQDLYIYLINYSVIQFGHGLRERDFTVKK